MSELLAQHQARKERLQRFAEAAARYERGPVVVAMPRPQLAPMPARRQYETTSRPSTATPIAWRILRAVADEFGMTIDEMRGRSHDPKFTTPRFVVIGLMIELTRLSLPAIGRQLGGRDHTTIINGRRRIEALLAGSEAFRNRFEQIKAGLV